MLAAIDEAYEVVLAEYREAQVDRLFSPTPRREKTILLGLDGQLAVGTTA